MSRSTTLDRGRDDRYADRDHHVDATFLMNHDVLQFVDSATGNTEYVQISGDPTSATTFNVIRGVVGTTPLASVASGSTST